MKTLTKVLSMALVIVSIASISIFAEVEPAGAQEAKEDTEYTLEEMLEYAYEDEKIAQAEYEAIMNEFNITRPFSNIARAEIKHEEAIISLYEARNLEVPEFNASTHVVLPETLEEIYEIGILAEINNIAMYNDFLEQDLDEDVKAVFTALRDASKNHLAAFERADENYSNRGIASNSNNPKGRNTVSRGRNSTRQLNKTLSNENCIIK